MSKNEKINKKLEEELKKQRKKSKDTISDFKKFAFSGNILDMSVGVVIGTGFKSIVTSFTNDIVMPVISLLTKRIDFTNLFISLDGNKYETLELAKAAGASTINYGVLITTFIDFLITAICIYIVIKQITKFKDGKKEEPKPTTKKCDFCKSEIDIEATRCPHCTSILEENKEKIVEDIKEENLENV